MEAIGPNERKPDITLIATLSRFFWETPRLSEAREAIQSLQRVLGLPKASSQWDMPKKPSKGGIKRQMPKPSQMTSFNKEQWFDSKLSPNDRAPHPIFTAEPSHPLKEALFGHLYPVRTFFPTAESSRGYPLIHWEKLQHQGIQPGACKY